MTREPLIAVCVLTAAACLMPLGRAAELVTLRNGFHIQCDRHAPAGGSMRIYLTAGDDNYIELPPSEIVSFARVASRPAMPAGAAEKEGTRGGFSEECPSAAKQAAEKRRTSGDSQDEAGAGVEARSSIHRFCGPTEVVPLLQGRSASSFSAACKAPTNFESSTARLKPCPFKATTSFTTSSFKATSFSGGHSAAPQPVLNPADLRQMLAKAGQTHNLDIDLLASIVHAESGGNPSAVSRAGARGLMQLMPATAAHLGVRDSFQPQQNVSGGSAYLDALLTRYSGNLALALAAYNAGPEAVDRYGGIPPYPETRAYVARVIHEFNRRVLARRAAAHVLPHKLHAAVSQK